MTKAIILVGAGRRLGIHAAALAMAVSGRDAVVVDDDFAFMEPPPRPGPPPRSHDNDVIGLGRPLSERRTAGRPRHPPTTNAFAWPTRSAPARLRS